MMPMFMRRFSRSKQVAAARAGRLHDDALGERHAGQRAELRVAALDELLEARRRQPRLRPRRPPAARNWLTWHASARRFVS